MSFDSIDNMKNWKTKDWANSWRGELPTNEFKDKTGNLINKAVTWAQNHGI